MQVVIDYFRLGIFIFNFRQCHNLKLVFLQSSNYLCYFSSTLLCIICSTTPYPLSTLSIFFLETESQQSVGTSTKKTGRLGHCFLANLFNFKSRNLASPLLSLASYITFIAKHCLETMARTCNQDLNDCFLRTFMNSSHGFNDTKTVSLLVTAENKYVLFIGINLVFSLTLCFIFNVFILGKQLLCNEKICAFSTNEALVNSELLKNSEINNQLERKIYLSILFATLENTKTRRIELFFKSLMST